MNYSLRMHLEVNASSYTLPDWTTCSRRQVSFVRNKLIRIPSSSAECEECSFYGFFQEPTPKTGKLTFAGSTLDEVVIFWPF